MFNRISEDWKRKRKYPWKPFVEKASIAMKKWSEDVNNQKNPSLFIDLGAGTGRNASFFYEVGTRLVELDISFQMLKHNDSQSEKIHASMDHLPFRNSTFNGIFSVAAIHHNQGKNSREKTITEIKRIGKKNALIGITVWRFYQPKFLQDYFSQMKNPTIPNKEQEIGDVIVPWKIAKGHNHKSIDRFYHLFRSGEFSQLVKPFKCLMKGLLGNRNERTNFYFFGINS